MTGRVIDYAWNGPSPAAVAACGFEGALRYLSRSPSKNITRVELAALRVRGLAVGFVWETSAARPLDGVGAGQSDAADANREADALGVPDDVCIYFACDSDQSFAAVRGYYAGARQVSRRPPGCYGGSHVFEGLFRAGLIVYAWQSESTSFSDGVSPHAAIIQVVGHPRPDPGGDWDENRVLKADWGQWAAPGRPSPRSDVHAADEGGVTPAESLLEDDMPTVVAQDFVVNPADPDQAYILDARGALHAKGSAVPLTKESGAAYWDNAFGPARRAFVVDWSKPSGYVMDCLGGLHPFGGAPKLADAPGDPAYWPGGFVPPAPVT